MTTELKVNELDQVTGGNFIPNEHSDEEYRECGIMVVNYIFYDDLFVWKGQQLGCFEAHHVVEFMRGFGTLTKVLAEEENEFWATACFMCFQAKNYRILQDQFKLSRP